MEDTDQIDELLAMLDSEEMEDRLTAARILGDIGDREALRVLRLRLNEVGTELQTLVVAVAKLKKKWGVK